MKKFTKVLISSLLCLGMTACAGSTTATTGSNEPAGNAGGSTDGKKFNVGIVQLVQHVALDAAAQGFQDELVAELGADAVDFNVQNASGDSATCASIVSGFVTEKSDLILAIATPALQAAANGTADIPVLGTAITEYGTALEIDDFNGTVGTNVSGTSDLAPLDQQADMFDELLPDAKRSVFSTALQKPTPNIRRKQSRSVWKKKARRLRSRLLQIPMMYRQSPLPSFRK